jgi:cell division protein FtsB
MKQHQIICQVFLLITLALYGCQGTEELPSKPEPNNQPLSQVETLKTSLGEAQKQLEVVETSLLALNASLKDHNQGEIDKTTINFTEAQKAWAEFPQKWQTLENEMKNFEQVDKNKITPAEKTIESLDKTIKLLEPKLLSDVNAIKALQTNLEIPLTQDSLGNFSGVTQRVLELKTADEIKSVKLALQDVENALAQLPQEIINNPDNNTGNPTIFVFPFILGLLGLWVAMILRYRRKRDKYKDIDLNNSDNSWDMIRSLEEEIHQLKAEVNDLNTEIQHLSNENRSLKPKTQSNLSISPMLSLPASSPSLPSAETSHVYTKSHPDTSTSSSSTAIPTVKIFTPQDLAKYYNQNPRILESNLEILTPTEESIQDTRNGRNVPIVLRISRSGNYWLYLQKMSHDGKVCYCLVPKARLVINTPTYETLKYIFNCEGYRQKNSDNFILKSPASVIQDQRGNWELITLGHLVFT